MSATVAVPDRRPAWRRPWAPRPGYLVSPAYDAIFFYLAPLLAVAAAVAGMLVPLARVHVHLLGRDRLVENLLLGILIHGHLVIVFLRSHLDAEVFRRHRLRFTVVPAALFASVLLFPRVRAAALVIGAFWDIYHSAQQTFGLGRIYDRLAGNDLEAGRSLDRWLNHLTYTGPALAGLALMGHLATVSPSLDALGQALFTDTVAYARVWRPWIATLLVGGGVPFVLFYLWTYRRLAGGGYRVSTPKVVLLAGTALVAVWTWSFDPYGRAYLVNNVFHALQYFGLVAYTQRKRMAAFGGSRGPELARSLGVVAAVGLGYGLLATTVGAGVFSTPWSAVGFMATLTVCVSLLHFWYDGFVWSVRRGQV